MEITLNLVIIGVTVVVSLLAFQDRNLKYSLTFSPYSVKHHNRWWLSITHAFVHVDYSHLIMNMIVLYYFGKVTESLLVDVVGSVFKGELYYFTLYIGAAIFATVPSMRKHSDNAGYLSVGASGAVSAILFAAIVMRPDMDIVMLFFPGLPIPSWLFGILYLAFEYYASKKGRTNIGHDAHIAGAIFGLVFILIIDYEIYVQFFNTVVNL